MTRSTPRPPGYVAGTWTIDSARSTVAFTIRHLLIHKVRDRLTSRRAAAATGTSAAPTARSAVAENHMAARVLR
jgi:polyisoprenoid-binding protein YceI